MDFEKFLEDIFLNLKEVGGIPITKDNFNDLFDRWLSRLETEDYMEFANLYGTEQFLKGRSEMLDRLKIKKYIITEDVVEFLFFVVVIVIGIVLISI